MFFVGTSIRKLLVSAFIALILTIPFVVQAEDGDYMEVPEAAFIDVPVGHRYYLPIRELRLMGVVNGRENADIPVEEWGFHPGDSVNRAEALVMIMRAVNQYVPDNSGVGIEGFDGEKAVQQEVEDYKLEFGDVADDVWFYRDLVKAVELGVVSGYEDGTFKPTNQVSLAEALTMLMRAYEVELPVEIVEPIFTDVESNVWYSPYFFVAKDWQVVNMTRSNEVKPHESMTRGELAELIYKVKLHMETGARFGSASYYSDRFEGRGTASGAVFTQNAFTAAHISLPFDTLVKVTNLRNGRSVVVKITDRGPYGHPGRRLDLSRSAFEAIGNTSSGYIFVEYTVLAE